MLIALFVVLFVYVVIGLVTFTVYRDYDKAEQERIVKIYRTLGFSDTRIHVEMVKQFVVRLFTWPIIVWKAK